MKKVKIKKMPKLRYDNGGPLTFPIAEGANSMTIAGNHRVSTAPNPNLQKNMIAYAPGALQTVGGLVDNLSESDDGTVSVGGKAVSGAFRGASTGLGIGAMFTPVGAAIGAGAGALIGGITQGINAGKQNQQMLEARKEEQKRERERTDMYSRAVLNVYPTTGVKDATYFAKGGRMKYAVGGILGGPGKPKRKPGTTHFNNAPVVHPFKEAQSTYQGISDMQAGERANPTFQGENLNNLTPGATIDDLNYIESLRQNRNAAPAWNTLKPLHKQMILGEAQKVNFAKYNKETDENLYNWYLNGFPKMAMGGQMPPANPNAQMPPVEGGETEQLAAGVHEVQGPTHEQGGVGIGQAEVEGGEVLQNTQEGVNVFSDRLEYDSGITFAQKAQELGEAKGKAEKALNEAEGIIAKNTAKRNIQKLDYELKRLFEMQESMKAEEGIENPEGMAAFGDTLVHALPYIDNLGNAIITAKTPKIPEPIYDEAVPLKTTFNINPQLEEINRQQSNLQRNLKTNTANSGTLRNQMIASGAMATGIRNQLYGQKENTENQLINQDALNRQATINANVLKENQTNMLKMQRVDDIHQRLSQNLSNAAEDAQMQIREDNMRRKDELEYEILKAKYKESGVIGRNIQAAIDAYDKSDIDFAEFQERLKQNAEAQKIKDAKELEELRKKGSSEYTQKDHKRLQKLKRRSGLNALGGTLRY